MGTGKSMYDRDTDPEFFRNPLKMFLNEKDLPRPENHRFGTFDPMYGFPNGRKQRECKTTWEMMERANIPYKYRDYCVDHYMEYQQCRQKYWPFFVMCKPVKHKYEDCEFEDHVMRLKEYERERRLLKRAKRKRQMQEKSDQELLE